MTLTLHELNCIRFYMGDEKIVNSGYFKGGPKAYNTINALLHDGIWDEIDKLKEGKTIEIYDAEHLKSYLDLIINIGIAMHKYLNCDNHHLITYRIDRLSAIQEIKKRMRIEGFYSTCKYGYLDDYAHTKADIILLEVVRDNKLPYLDFEELFKDNYAKKEEAEILIPFNTKVERIEELALTESEELRYYDMYHQKPKGKYRLILSSNDYGDIENVDYNELIKADNIEKLIACIKELEQSHNLSDENKSYYLWYKETLRKYVLNKIKEKADVL